MDKLCVITGTSSGIGESTARALLEQQWEVVGLARRESPIQHEGYRHFKLDLGDGAAVQRFFEEELPGSVTLASYGKVGLINNAAMLATVGPQEKLPLEEMAQAYLLNTATPVWLMGHFIRACPDARLYLVNISSGAAVNARAGWSTYCSSKAALRMAGLVAAEDLQDFPEYESRRGRVSIVSLAPGVVATPMQTSVRESDPAAFPSVQRFVDFHRNGMLKEPDRPGQEIARLLATDDLPLYTDVDMAQA